MKTRQHPLFLGAIAGLVLSAGSLHSATIQVDIQSDGTNTADAPTQSGWNAWELSETFSSGTKSTTFAYADATDGTLDVSLVTTTGAGARNYGIDAVTDPANLTVSDVWFDQFFFNNNTSGTLTLRLDDLKAGTYQATTYHYADNLSASAASDDSGIADISINGVDTGLNTTFVVGHDGAEPKTAVEVEASKRTFQFTVASDGDTVNILYDGLDTNGGGDSFGISGFALTQIPEPSSVAMLGLGGLVLLLRRRM